MKKARMNISHFRFTLCNLKIFCEIVTTFIISPKARCELKDDVILSGLNYSILFKDKR